AKTAQFQWDFGSAAAPATSNKIDPGKIRFFKHGTFPVTLTVTFDGCIKKYTDNVEVLQKPNSDYTIENTVSCELTPVHFINKSTGAPPLQYTWNFGDESTSDLLSPYHTYKKIGNYSTSLMVSSVNGCRDTFELPNVIAVQKLPIAGFDVDPKDTSVFYATINLTDHSKYTSACKMFWGDGNSEGDCIMGHTYTTPGIYEIMQIAENNGCFDTAYVEVVVRPDFVFWLPNAFTPGRNDDLNDVYKPVIVGAHDYHFLIFDRWGQQLFETNDLNGGWNGYLKGRLCETDVYVYKIDFIDDVKLRPHHYVGHFTLVR
ncbi:MAG TPA: PKD domain-containing protein, partial [Bacteroidia bacterium]|nr:PKD domain-containing protein [Bacteroidia bacterium]